MDNLRCVFCSFHGWRIAAILLHDSGIFPRLSRSIPQE
ncbi:hypothetical protein D556_2521 [Bordetella holmesii 41130]|nr:hypothetical protein D560_2543 [Bordetella holmesii ATCC 51541]EWM44359.1 hypothetical protein D556_2521 [Bordetella holmesii 41130]EWM47768.1 hypothetical protein D555_2559 [Bordetella holmesii 35009]